MNRRTWVKTAGVMGAGMITQPNLSLGNSSVDKKQLLIKPDWDKPTPIRHTWSGLGNVDQLRWVMRGDMQAQLKMCHKELGLRHVRAVGAFDDDLWVLSRDPAQYFNKNRSIKEGTRINWRSPFYIYDTLVDMGINPIVTTCFTPTEMRSSEKTVFQTKSNVSPPQDWKSWEGFIKNFIQSLVDRYGVETLKGWYFEAWNEPNLEGFWTGGKDGYWRLYQLLYDTIKAVDPGLRIGGPSTARGEWIDELLVFGEKNDCIPDYIIGHCYNNDSANAPLSPFEGAQKDKENKSPNFTSGVVRGIRKIMDEHDFQGEFHMNEWGLSWYPFNPVRETSNEAAFIVKTMNEVSQEADLFAYWCLSDIYNQVGYGREAFHGNYGMLSMDGLRKPNYFAHVLLGMLGNQKVPVKGKGLDHLSNAFVTTSNDAVQALAYHFDINYQAGDPQSETEVTLTLPQNIEKDSARIYRLDEEHNNIVKSWQDMGAPAIPTRKELQILKDQNELKGASATHLVAAHKNSNELKFVMKGPGVVFIEAKKVK